MLKLKPTFKSYIWGGHKLEDLFGYNNCGEKISESWEISVHPDGMSTSENGTLAEYLTANPHALSSQDEPFPVLIKYIDAAQNLSVQVHPNDDYARRMEGDNGKTEMWYIISADNGAGIYCGFQKDTTKEEFLSRLREGTVEKLLNFIPVKTGDCFLIKAGTVHAICAGCVICEVQQSSNVTYRIYDYNRRDAAGNTRPLHIEKALNVINFGAFYDETGSGKFELVEGGKLRLLTQCDYFRCRELLLNGTFTDEAADSFIAVNVLEGEGKIGETPFVAGNSFFVPCGETMTLNGKAKIILTNK